MKRSFDPRENEDTTPEPPPPAHSMAAEYERRAREVYEHSNGKRGLRVNLYRGRPFYSKGWTGCPWCWGDAHEGVNLYYFKEVRANGVVVSGWRCKP